jgi:hypothetical protein
MNSSRLLPPIIDEQFEAVAANTVHDPIGIGLQYEVLPLEGPVTQRFDFLGDIHPELAIITQGQHTWQTHGARPAVFPTYAEFGSVQ